MLYYDEIYDLMPMAYIRNGCGSFQSLSATRLEINCWPIINGIIYQGPLRAYLLFPLIFLGMLNPVTITIFSFALLSVCGFVVYKITKALGYSNGGSLLALITFISLPIVWISALYDFGPVTSQMLVRVCMLFSIAKDLKIGRFSSPVTVALAALLIWGKMDGIWFVSSAILGSILIHFFVKRKTLFIKSLSDVIYLFIAFLGFATSMFVTRYQGANQIDIDLVKKLKVQIPMNLSVGTLPIAYNFDSFTYISLGQILSYFFLFSALFVIIFLRINAKSTLLEKFTYVTAIQTLAIYLFIIVTPRATAPWHTASLMPSALFPCLYLILRLWGLSKDVKLLSLSKICTSFLLCIILTLTGVSNYQIYSTISNENPKALLSKDLITKLTHFTSSASENTAVVFASWGLYNTAVINLSPKQKQQSFIYDGWSWFMNGISEKDAKTQDLFYYEGPLKDYRDFIFIGINLVPGSAGLDLIKQIEDAHLCLINSQDYEIGADNRLLTVVKASKC
jgi:hypothetical protein